MIDQPTTDPIELLERLLAKRTFTVEIDHATADGFTVAVYRFSHTEATRETIQTRPTVAEAIQAAIEALAMMEAR